MLRRMEKNSRTGLRKLFLPTVRNAFGGGRGIIFEEKTEITSKTDIKTDWNGRIPFSEFQKIEKRFENYKKTFYKTQNILSLDIYRGKFKQISRKVYFTAVRRKK